MAHHRILFIALSTLPWAAAVAQPNFDCDKATTAAENAICASPELAAADAAMTRAYGALLKTLPPAGQAALKADQHDWVTGRDGGCFDKKDAALSQCLFAATDQRRRFLLGEGDNGAAGAPALLPVYFRESRRGAYEITIAYPQFAAPAAPKFNAAVHAIVFGKDLLSEHRANSPNPHNGGSNSYDVSYEVTYLDANLASATLQFGSYQGGAHPNNWRVGMMWNPASDRPLALANFLADPKKAVPVVSAFCKAVGEKEHWGLFDDPDFATVVKDSKSWAIDKGGVTLMFDAYSVTPYVAGPHDCRMTYADLKDWLKPGGPLPPKQANK